LENFIYGASYYPLNHEEKDWERDLKTMKENGINLVRTAEIFNTWDTIEAEECKFDFAFLDNFFDLCEKYEIKILLGTGTASPPVWLNKKHSEVNIVSSTGVQYPVNASYTWACIDNEVYLEKSKIYLEKLVGRYKDHKALGAYQIHNEIGFPFMASANGEMENYCFCEDSKKAFIVWVKEKYKTLESLNQAWRWSATNQVHIHWDEIEPPRLKPAAWSSVTRWLDWRLFWMDNFVRFVKWQNDLIKDLDRVHPTSTNIFFMKSQDNFGVMMGLDQYKMAEVVDFIGYDLYPGSGNKLEKKPEYTSMFLDHARSISKPINKNYWLMEAESGPINGWILGPDKNTSQKDIEKNAFEAIGKDAKFILYQLWREPLFQPLHWGGIVDLEGNETPRAKACKKVKTFLEEDGKFIMDSNTPKGEIGILMSRENATIASGMGQEKFLLEALRGAYRVFWEMGYSIDFITPELLEKDYCLDYKAIITPFMAVIDEKTTEKLSEYVHKGGKLISGARTGMLDHRGWYNPTMPPGRLKETFGLEIIDVEANVNPELTMNFKNYKGHWQRENINIISENLKVVGRYNNDKPSVTINSYGLGEAIYFTTHADVAHLKEGSDLLWDIVKNYLSPPDITVEYSNRSDKEIDLNRLVSEDRELLIMTSYVPKGKSFFVDGKKYVDIRVKLENRPKKLIDYFSKKEITFNLIEGVVTFGYEVLKDKTCIIEIIK